MFDTPTAVLCCFRCPSPSPQCAAVRPSDRPSVGVRVRLAAMSARRVVRFVLDGQPAVSVTAHLPLRSSSQQPSPSSASQPGGASKGKPAASRKRTVRPSLPSFSAAAADADGDSDMAAATAQRPDDTTEQPHSQAATAASPAASVSSSAASSPPLLAASEWSRAVPSQPDVQSVRAELANVALPAAAQSATHAGSSSGSNGGSAASISAHFAAKHFAVRPAAPLVVSVPRSAAAVPRLVRCGSPVQSAAGLHVERVDRCCHRRCGRLYGRQPVPVQRTSAGPRALEGGLPGYHTVVRALVRSELDSGHRASNVPRVAERRSGSICSGRSTARRVVPADPQ